ncbi:MAG: hypothetical protein IKF52_06355 [Clostridia bacterium]|nr:hypothetical protein [Clostridia bacterium]
MSKNQKTIRRILLVLIILMIILMIFLSFIKSQTSNNSSNTSQENNTNEEIESFSSHYNDEVISFSNSASDVYKGKMPAYEITYQIQSTFEGYLPMVSEDIQNKTEEELKEYFTKEQELVYLNLGINNEQKFINFVKKLEDINLSSYELVTYIEDSYEKNEEDEVIEFKVKYKSGKEIRCKAHITNIIEFEII